MTICLNRTASLLAFEEADPGPEPIYQIVLWQG